MVGWGLVFVEHGLHTMAGALPGPWQTAQRAEVYAVLMALSVFTRPRLVLTDSRYVHDRLDSFLMGDRPRGAHEDLWSQIHSLLGRLAGVRWVKAHLTLREAKSRGIPEESTGASTPERMLRLPKVCPCMRKTRVTGPYTATEAKPSGGGSCICYPYTENFGNARLVRSRRRQDSPAESAVKGQGHNQELCAPNSTF